MAKVPDERSLVESFGDRAFALLGVNADPPADDLLRRTRRRGITWRSFADGAPLGPIATAWGVSAFPTTYLIDPEGVVVAINLPPDELRRAIQDLLPAVEDQ